ncbi:hypothetical protein LEP1GSC108_3729 [Leptospira weilii str. UI 13098]|uniref:Uncharacterized protein n=1 Tax=Leptospira weilii str. UI 13098 TaxID=1088542 RepID=M6QJK4_9LEPT|nr:hypothetical protein LEP1GSC108_3729 [Leptospira weilii str. UI 13098]
MNFLGKRQNGRAGEKFIETFGSQRCDFIRIKSLWNETGCASVEAPSFGYGADYSIILYVLRFDFSFQILTTRFTNN